MVKTLAEYAPEFAGRWWKTARSSRRKTSKTTYGLTGGHIFHGELALDQFFTMRPLLDWARYSTPIQNLYLCGSGTHPGAGLTGGSGANAAREILKNCGDNQTMRSQRNVRKRRRIKPVRFVPL